MAPPAARALDRCPRMVLGPDAHVVTVADAPLAGDRRGCAPALTVPVAAVPVAVPERVDAAEAGDAAAAG